MITYSSPGKIHFLGEHSVVHGKPALLAATNLRTYITIRKGVKLNHPEGNDEIFKLKETVEKVLKEKIKVKKLPKYFVSIDSKIPMGAGMGSSAAASSAYIATLLDFLKIKWDLNLINELAFECEKVFNGNPSGGDNTTVVYGGFIWYRKELDFLKTFKPLPFKLHKNIKQFYLIDSGKPVETTAEMVSKVKNKFLIRTSNPGLEVQFQTGFGNLLNRQEQLVKELAIALKEGGEDNLIDIIKKGERNLEKLGVVGKVAKDIIRKVENIGGACKIMGGGGFKGGSGMLLAYHKNPKILTSLAKQFKITKISLGEEGLRKEE